MDLVAVLLAVAYLAVIGFLFLAIFGGGGPDDPVHELDALPPPVRRRRDDEEDHEHDQIAPSRKAATPTSMSLPPHNERRRPISHD